MSHLITLQQIRGAKPCAYGWTTLLTALGENHAAPDLTCTVSIGDVAKSNGAQDALWCCRLVSDRRAVVRAIMPAVKRASAHTTDKRVHDCIAAVERWQAGDNGVDLRAEAAAWAAEAAAWEAEAARAAMAAASAARASSAAAAKDAAWAAREAAMAASDADAAAAVDAREAEFAKQVADIIAVFPLHAFAEPAG